MKFKLIELVFVAVTLLVVSFSSIISGQQPEGQVAEESKRERTAAPLGNVWARG